MRFLIMFVPIVVLAAGCAAGNPVLYPNAHLKQAGEERAARDVAECKQRAEEYVKSDAAVDTAKSTAAGGAAGAVIGGAAGAVTGNLGRGAGIGAATGAAAGLVQGVAKGSEPSPLYKNFVDRCLRERGYEVIGWE